MNSVGTLEYLAACEMTCAVRHQHTVRFLIEHDFMNTQCAEKTPVSKLSLPHATLLRVESSFVSGWMPLPFVQGTRLGPQSIAHYYGTCVLGFRT